MTKIALCLAGALMFAASTAQAADPQEEANKKVVLDFYEKAINQKNFEAAAVHFGPAIPSTILMPPTGPTGSGRFWASCARSSRRPGARSSACSPRATT